MTFENAREIFLNRGYEQVDGGSIYNPDKWRESIIVISNWLQQEPCGDTISRQAVLEIVEREQNKGDALFGIEHLPPVQPQPKTGHWEWVQYDYNPKLGNWHCSECRCVVVECVDKNEKGGIPLYKYCPQCGAKMVEPQAESKEKSILDKIRAEILEEKECAYADFERYKVEYLGQGCQEAYDSLPYDDFRYGMERCIEIIDEYREKREGEQEIKKGGEHG